MQNIIHLHQWLIKILHIKDTRKFYPISVNTKWVSRNCIKFISMVNMFCLKKKTITASHMASNEADLYDMECMSPLYATPPHSPSSELSSPGQLPSINNIDDCVGASSLNGGGSSASCSGGKSVLPDNHFARDTHMRIILGNLKENQASSSRYLLSMEFFSSNVEFSQSFKNNLWD